MEKMPRIEAVEVVGTMHLLVHFDNGEQKIYDIAGNKYRLVVAVNYPYQALYIHFVGTHGQYDQINAAEV